MFIKKSFKNINASSTKQNINENSDDIDFSTNNNKNAIKMEAET